MDSSGRFSRFAHNRVARVCASIQRKYHSNASSESSFVRRPVRIIAESLHQACAGISREDRRAGEVRQSAPSKRAADFARGSGQRRSFRRSAAAGRASPILHGAPRTSRGWAACPVSITQPHPAAGSPSLRQQYRGRAGLIAGGVEIPRGKRLRLTSRAVQSARPARSGHAGRSPTCDREACGVRRIIRI